MNKNHLILLLLAAACIVVSPGAVAQSTLLMAENGKVDFVSEAPLEIIKASSDKLKAAIDKSKNTFAFAVEIRSFRGFNSALQKEHFHENYMETDWLPIATFTGKFIEQIDFSVNGTHPVRAKGKFTIHGVQKERVIKGVITINNGIVDMNTDFTVRLEDYDIKVPKIVYEKIAAEIKINVAIKFKK